MNDSVKMYARSIKSPMQNFCAHSARRTHSHSSYFTQLYMYNGVRERAAGVGGRGSEVFVFCIVVGHNQIHAVRVSTQVHKFLSAKLGSHLARAVGESVPEYLAVLRPASGNHCLEP